MYVLSCTARFIRSFNGWIHLIHPCTSTIFPVRTGTLSGGVNCCVQDARDACGIFFQPIAVHCLRRLGKLLTASCICTDQIIDHIPGMSNDCEHMHYAGKWLSRHKVNNVIIVPTGSVPCAAIESSSVRATKTRVAG